MKRNGSTKLLAWCALLAGACGGQTSLTPEIIGQKTFDLLKTDDFTGYFTTIVATPAIVKDLCPALPGIDRYFETGEGSERLQNDRFIACRTTLDFSRATLRGVQTDRKSPEVVTPQCANAIEHVEVKVSVVVDGRPASFTIAGVMQFRAGWRAYRRIKDCQFDP